jgi:hypothetical protein
MPDTSWAKLTREWRVLFEDWPRRGSRVLGGSVVLSVRIDVPSACARRIEEDAHTYRLSRNRSEWVDHDCRSRIRQASRLRFP